MVTNDNHNHNGRTTYFDTHADHPDGCRCTWCK